MIYTLSLRGINEARYNDKYITVQKYSADLFMTVFEYGDIAININIDII